MAIRILKVQDEDLELLNKLITNMHRKVTQQADHPVFSPYLMSIHRLFEQVQNGLPTELEYARTLKGVAAAFAEAEEKEKIQNRERRKARLEKAGIKSKSVDEVEELPIDKPRQRRRAKPASQAKPKPKAKPRKQTKAVPIKKVGPCEIHNNSGARSPRTECPGCWDYYKVLHPDRYQGAWEKFKALNNG